MKKISSILIVGGGTSGWMAAAYLSKLLFDVRITLVESRRIPVIGVGEATVPLINNFMRRIGFPEPRMWMNDCDATFKTAILFENWAEQGDRYCHPFDYLDYVDARHHVGHCWLHWRQNGQEEFRPKQSFYDSFFCSSVLNLGRHLMPASSEFAYHFDAHLFADLLRRTSENVQHLIDDVVEVKLTETGDVECLETAAHGGISADLYLDCTGFQRRLISAIDPNLHVQANSRSLFTDRAVVLRFPYQSEEDCERQMFPYVRASARSAGWIWTIPLYSKISTGYVYSSCFLSEEQAELELRRYWGEERTRPAGTLKLKFQTGCLERLWLKNCVAIGLAGGFVEPLESTGLAITQTGVEFLGSMLDARYYDDGIIARYNMHLHKFYTDIINFIIVHYGLTQREDTAFWRAVKHETWFPDELRARLDTFRRYLPTFSTRGTSEAWMFGDFSWFSILLGMNFAFDSQHPPATSLESAMEIRLQKQRFIEEMTPKLPNHYRYLRSTRNPPPAAPS